MEWGKEEGKGEGERRGRRKERGWGREGEKERERENKRRKLTSSDWQCRAGMVVLRCHQDVASPCRLPKMAAHTLATTSSLQAARRKLG